MSFLSNIFGTSKLKPLGKMSEQDINPKVKRDISVVTAFEETRDGLPKAYIPNFFYRAPFRLSQIQRP